MHGRKHTEYIICAENSILKRNKHGNSECVRLTIVTVKQVVTTQHKLGREGVLTMHLSCRFPT